MGRAWLDYSALNAVDWDHSVVLKGGMLVWRNQDSFTSELALVGMALRRQGSARTTEKSF